MRENEKNMRNGRSDRTAYVIEIWRGHERVEVVAVTYRRSIAIAAFDAACRLRLAPGLVVILRQGGVVIRRDIRPPTANEGPGR